jgi:hypothetical protein
MRRFTSYPQKFRSAMVVPYTDRLLTVLEAHSWVSETACDAILARGRVPTARLRIRIAGRRVPA